MTAYDPDWYLDLEAEHQAALDTRLHERGLVDRYEGRRGGTFTIAPAGVAFLRSRAA